MDRSPFRRLLLIALTLTGAMVLFAGCGPEDSNLLQESKLAVSSSKADARVTNVDVLGEDATLEPAAITSIDDPILGSEDAVPGLAGDDLYSAAQMDWDDHEGSSPGLSMISDDDFDEAPMPAYDGGYDDGVDTIDVASVGAAAPMMDAGFDDAGAMDADVMDAGFEDPGVGAAGVMDVGLDPAVDPSVGLDF